MRCDRAMRSAEPIVFWFLFWFLSLSSSCASHNKAGSTPWQQQQRISWKETRTEKEHENVDNETREESSHAGKDHEATGEGLSTWEGCTDKIGTGGGLMVPFCEKDRSCSSWTTGSLQVVQLRWLGDDVGLRRVGIFPDVPPATAGPPKIAAHSTRRSVHCHWLGRVNPNV